MVDSWINNRFAGLSPHPLISDPMFRTGATGGAPDWQITLAGVREVRDSARRFLDSEPGPDLDLVIPYDGSIEFLRSSGLSLRYSLMRIAAHHFLHAGEILEVRSRMGHIFGESSDWGRSLA